MKLSEATRLVLEDSRQSYTPSEMTDVECLAHTYDTVSDDCLDESTPELAQAYHVFFNAMGHMIYGKEGPRLTMTQAAKELLV